MPPRTRPPINATRSLSYIIAGSTPHWTFDTLPYTVGRYQLLIRIEVSTLSTVDLAIINTPETFTSPTEKGIGRDFAGVIVQVGSSLSSKWKAGDAVCGMYYHPYGAGTFASHVLIDPSKDHIVIRPEALPVLEAAAIPLSFTLALQCLNKTKLTSDSTVCVLGGGTSVGLYAIQLAKKYFDVKTIVATCGPKSDNLVKYMGADKTVDYTTTEDREMVNSLLSTLGSSSGYDLVVDTIGASAAIMERMKDLTPAKTGWFVSTVGDRSESPYGSFLSYNIGKSLMGAIRGPRYTVEYARSNLAALQLAVDMYCEGRLKVNIDTILSWDKFSQAFDLLQSGDVHGKIVIKVDEF
ncbi:uncharacterized protein V1518DRAFT_413835 [Limtongia smithiae]|uniref:uncharacterized protein n=1 Tax=Limtongia smithiae TaxID=1125753 RepID=UPI0034CF19DA